MQLASFLRESGISLNAFARQIGAKNARTVQRYTKHGRIPSSRMMQKIVTATEGKVQPNDFYSAAAE